MSTATAISIPLYAFSGRLVGRRGPAKLLSFGIGIRMFAFAGLTLLGFLHVSWGILPVIVLLGLYQCIWPVLSVSSNDLAASLAPFGEGAAMGLFSAATAIGSALGAVAGGGLADMAGYPAVIMFAAIGVSLSPAFILKLPADRGQVTVTTPLMNNKSETAATMISAAVASFSYRVKICLPLSFCANQNTGTPAAKMMVDNSTNFGPAAYSIHTA